MTTSRRAHTGKRVATAARRWGMRALVIVLSLVASSLAAPRARAQLVVTSAERGILRVAPDGTPLEVLSPTPAALGRMRGEHALVFLVAGRNELRELDLATRVERVIAALPGELGLGCGGLFGSRLHGTVAEPYVLADHLHFEASMAVDDTRACFEVMDRNLNMASVILDVEVSLASGTITHQVAFSEECGALDDAAREALPCTPVLRAAARQAPGSVRARPMPWSLEGEGDRVRLVGPRGRSRRVAILDASIETVSRDGRWAVVAGNREEGDYLYRSLYLLDRRRGAIHPIGFAGDDPGAGAEGHSWPAALSPAELADPVRVAGHGFVVTGETSVRWIEAGRALVLGGDLVVRPGRGVARLPGLLVR